MSHLDGLTRHESHPIVSAAPTRRLLPSARSSSVWWPDNRTVSLTPFRAAEDSTTPAKPASIFIDLPPPAASYPASRVNLFHSRLHKIKQSMYFHCFNKSVCSPRTYPRCMMVATLEGLVTARALFDSRISRPGKLSQDRGAESEHGAACGKFLYRKTTLHSRKFDQNENAISLNPLRAASPIASVLRVACCRPADR
jgi:hypothetical protein